MTTPATYTVDADTLHMVYLSGYCSAMATAVTNREALARITSINTDDEAMEFGRAAAERIDSDPESRAATWRVILACLSGVTVPTAVVKPNGGPS